MTDDQLETLLRDTFTSREPLADPDVARRMARSVGAPARRWPAYVAAAAAVLVVALVGAFLAHGHDAQEPPVVDPTPPPATTATYQENRALAAAESARVVELVPLPESATRLPRKPAGWPGRGMISSPADASLAETAWWSVPVDAGSLETYLTAHEPGGMHREEGFGSSSDLEGHVVRYLSYAQDRSTTPDAYQPVSLLVQWMADGDHTLVRADTSTAARDVRTPETYVDGEVTAVDIDRVVPHPPDNQRLPPVHLTAPDDSADIARLVDAVNGLPASIKPAFVASCPYPGDPRPFVTLTFHTAAGTVVAHLETACWGQVEIRRDGQPVRPTLDPGDLTEVVEAAVGNR
ncbi:MAG: hypothetical protein JWN91_830 [Nocardioides sp.]|jgi:hypothetical protein|nr:hypothetical protein [Nocardioides sp.]